MPDRRVDLIYLCYPNNPTGTVATRETLKKWVDYARANEAIIFFDAAYEAYITDPEIPHSIFEIDGARDVAIEFRSFSKTAGFTGTRCAFTVVPKELTGKTSTGKKADIHPPLESPANDEIQRRRLRHSARGRGGLFPRRQAASRRADRVLP